MVWEHNSARGGNNNHRQSTESDALEFLALLQRKWEMPELLLQWRLTLEADVPNNMCCGSEVQSLVSEAVG